MSPVLCWARTTLGNLTKIPTLAVETIDGCDHAGISLVQSRRISTPAASDDVPVQVDAIQYETDEGPCIDAIREHETFRTDDLATEDRWPKFSRRAAEETGVVFHAVLPPLRRERPDGGPQPLLEAASAFDDEALAVGRVFATHAAVALAGAQHDEQMKTALQARDIIGQAKGILMAQQKVSSNEAFDILRRASQRMNRVAPPTHQRPGSRSGRTPGNALGRGSAGTPPWRLRRAPGPARVSPTGKKRSGSL
jgi:hypothetical protein